MEHVFQRFWRGSEQPGGCGLGLAIVQRNCTPPRR
jgi:two-component system, OmpR family, sensor histidine kinase TctE